MRTFTLVNNLILKGMMYLKREYNDNKGVFYLTEIANDCDVITYTEEHSIKHLKKIAGDNYKNVLCAVVPILRGRLSVDYDKEAILVSKQERAWIVSENGGVIFDITDHVRKNRKIW